MLADVRDEVTGVIRAAGVEVTDDPRDLTVPGVLVGVPARGAPRSTVVWEAVIVVRVIGAPPGNLDALTWLMDTTDRLLIALPGPVGFEAATETIAGAECPVYQLTVPITLTAPCP